MRQVGITGINLLNLYYAMLNLSISGGCAKITPAVNGDVVLSADPAEDVFCIEPVKSIVSSAALTEDIYFVPAFDFTGIKVNGSDISVSGVVADGQSLYRLAAGATITKVSL